MDVDFVPSPLTIILPQASRQDFRQSWPVDPFVAVQGLVKWRVVRSNARALGARLPEVATPAARGACPQHRTGDGDGRIAGMAARISWNGQR